METERTPGTGPGLEPQEGIDKSLLAGAALVLIGFTPVDFWAGIIGYGYFGPLAWPAIFAMVGVLFGVIALLRSLDLEDRTLRNASILVLVLGLLRLFIAPMLS
ncbi:MAG: hypothetical protein ACPHID_08590 [Thermoplasmatota archaeon]